MDNPIEAIESLNTEIELTLAKTPISPNELQGLFQKTIHVSKNLTELILEQSRSELCVGEKSRLLVLQSIMLRNVSKLNRKLIANSRLSSQDELDAPQAI